MNTIEVTIVANWSDKTSRWIVAPFPGHKMLINTAYLATIIDDREIANCKLQISPNEWVGISETYEEMKQLLGLR